MTLSRRAKWISVLIVILFFAVGAFFHILWRSPRPLDQAGDELRHTIFDVWLVFPVLLVQLFLTRFAPRVYRSRARYWIDLLCWCTLLVVLAGGTGFFFSGSENDQSYDRAVEISVALKRYRYDLGRYPDDLQALVPKYMKEIPRPTIGLSDQPYRYAPEMPVSPISGYTLTFRSSSGMWILTPNGNRLKVRD